MLELKATLWSLGLCTDVTESQWCVGIKSSRSGICINRHVTTLKLFCVFSFGASLFHAIEYIEIVRLLFLKKVRFEKKKKKNQCGFSKDDHQIISPLIENESRGGGKRIPCQLRVQIYSLKKNQKMVLYLLESKFTLSKIVKKVLLPQKRKPWKIPTQNFRKIVFCPKSFSFSAENAPLIDRILCFFDFSDPGPCQVILKSPRSC